MATVAGLGVAAAVILAGAVKAPWLHEGGWPYLMGASASLFSWGCGYLALCARGLREVMGGGPPPSRRRRECEATRLADLDACTACGSRTWIPAGKTECCGTCGGLRR